MPELKVKPFGPTFYKELTHLVMQFKMEKETHLLIHGQKLLPQPENIILLIITSIFLSWILYIINQEPHNNKRMLLPLNSKELLPIMRILIITLMENFHSIFNKLELLEITPQPQPILKLSTGEETILFKKVLLLELPIMDGHHQIILTGIWPEPTIWPLIKMPLLSETMLHLMLLLIYILKINKLIMEEMLGDKLKEKMLLDIQPSMPTNLVMAPFKEIPTLILETEELPVFLIWEVFIWLLNRFKVLLMPVQLMLTKMQAQTWCFNLEVLFDFK